MDNPQEGPSSYNSSSLFQPPPSYAPSDHDTARPEKIPVPEFASSATTSDRTYYASSPSSPEHSSLPPGVAAPPGIAAPPAEASSISPFQPPELPLSFYRAPPSELLYPSFKPTFIAGLGKSLDKGFPALPPPSDAQPHPFISHDVGEADWLEFLNAVRSAATLTDKDKHRSHLPIISIIPVVNSLASLGIQTIMKHKKGGKVARTIDMWNHHFFGPRKTRVILMKGKERLTGLTELPTSSDYVKATPPNLARISVDDEVYRLFIVSI
ncbi:hypothetical protein CPB84DRAFT_1845582 [Gymnopilus junonius]|uniref:Uncharacterized protein n=1 Tax=Gymnopilus junonius TaxID=109634 RepID=A0A9P5NSW1_GYMJU|nr:hypothetical protein CPB84DRAFT_1845582 [Gymnopilus junonius]